MSSADQGYGVATYRLPTASGNGYTLLGSPTVIANLKVNGQYPFIAERLWDVNTATGTETLVARGIFRLDPSHPSGVQVFQLHPGAWHFAAGHVPKLELLGQDSPYVRTSNGQFSITVTGLQVRLPVHEVPRAAGTPPASGRRRPSWSSKAPAVPGRTHKPSAQPPTFEPWTPSLAQRSSSVAPNLVTRANPAVRPGARGAQPAATVPNRAPTQREISRSAARLRRSSTRGWQPRRAPAQHVLRPSKRPMRRSATPNWRSEILGAESASDKRCSASPNRLSVLQVAAQVARPIGHPVPRTRHLPSIRRSPTQCTIGPSARRSNDHLRPHVLTSIQIAASVSSAGAK